jgi:hypothetical protein
MKSMAWLKFADFLSNSTEVTRGLTVYVVLACAANKKKPAKPMAVRVSWEESCAGCRLLI